MDLFEGLSAVPTDYFSTETAEPAQDPAYGQGKSVTWYVNTCVFPILLIVGLIFNTAAFIFCWPKSRKMASFVFMTALCMADNLVMLGIPLRKFLLDAVGVDLIQYLGCNVASLLRSYPGHYSVSLLVALNCERTYMIFRPLGGRKMRIWQAWLAVALLGLLAGAVSWTHFGGLEAGSDRGGVQFEDNCVGKFPAAQSYYADIQPLVGAAYYSYIPIAVLTISSLTIGIKMKRFGNKIGPNGESSSALKDLLRISRLTLALSSLFIVVTLPLMITLPIFRLELSQASEIQSENKQLQILQSVVHVFSCLSMTNHSLNFFVFMAFSRQFRKDVYNKVFGRSMTVTSTV